jgi:hypothetical protein
MKTPPPQNMMAPGFIDPPSPFCNLEEWESFLLTLRSMDRDNRFVQDLVAQTLDIIASKQPPEGGLDEVSAFSEAEVREAREIARSMLEEQGVPVRYAADGESLVLLSSPDE